jgi:hypothetical protein
MIYLDKFALVAVDWALSKSQTEKAFQRFRHIVLYL